MKRWRYLFITLTTALVFSHCTSQKPELRIQPGEKNPWTHLNLQAQSGNFRFAIVGDRSSHHRPGVFENAVARLTALNPAFVISVGDLIDTGDYKANPEIYDEMTIRRLWNEFNSMAAKLPMPFFYVSGNNDIRNMTMQEIWHEQFGRIYYSFLYHDVLFVVLNSDDPPGSEYGSISDTQIEWLQHTLNENSAVRWTLIFLHRPLWVYEEQQDWPKVETILADRPRTVFAGHRHRYSKSVLNGHAYYVLATTGGSSNLSGVAEGRFDHVVWVTMTAHGPDIMNLMLEGIWDDDPATELRISESDTTARQAAMQNAK